MNNFARLPDADDVHRIGGNGLLVLLRALFLEVAETSNDKPFVGAPFPLGELDSKERRRSLDSLRSIKRRGLATYKIRRGFALVTLTAKGRDNATAMASWCFGMAWRELDLARYLFATFCRCECKSCGTIFYVRGRTRHYCGLECKGILRAQQNNQSAANRRRKSDDVIDPVAAQFDAQHADELSPLAEAILLAEATPETSFELTCRTCGTHFVAEHHSALYCSDDCHVQAKRTAGRAKWTRQRDRELAKA